MRKDIPEERQYSLALELAYEILRLMVWSRKSPGRLDPELDIVIQHTATIDGKTRTIGIDTEMSGRRFTVDFSWDVFKEIFVENVLNNLELSESDEKEILEIMEEIWLSIFENGESPQQEYRAELGNTRH